MPAIICRSPREIAEQALIDLHDMAQGALREWSPTCGYVWTGAERDALKEFVAEIEALILGDAERVDTQRLWRRYAARFC